MKGKSGIIKNLFISRITKLPYKINLAVTFQCVSKCLTCNIWKKYRDNPELAKDELKFWEIDALFKNLPSIITWLSLTGGEPFLRTDLADIIRSAAKNIPSLGIINIPSNGLYKERMLSVIEEIMKDNLSVPDIFITFSIDGPSALHNKIRGIDGAFEKTWDTYSAVKNLTKNNKKFHIGLEVTLSKWNIDYLKTFLSDLINEGHNVTLAIAHNAYLYDNQKENELLPQHYLRQASEIIEILNRPLTFIHPRELIEKLYLQNIPAYLDNKTKQVIPCVALKASLAVNAFGDVISCFMWGKKIGNVRDSHYDITGIWRSHEAECTRLLINKGKCANCWTPCEAYQSIICHPLKAFISKRN